MGGMPTMSIQRRRTCQLTMRLDGAGGVPHDAWMLRAMARQFGVGALAVVLAAAAAAGGGQTAPAGDGGAAYLVTFGPGTAVHELFGHNAIIIDEPGRRPVAYNYGIFEFDPWFIWRFLRGELWYRVEADPDAQLMIAAYHRAGRTVWVHRLNLSSAQRRKLREFLEWNVLPENQRYFYNYYTDNCSTRLRDALDLALNGEIRRQLEPIPTGTTYRWHTRRLTQQRFALYSGLQFVLGPAIDRPLNAWEESFLPECLIKHLGEVRLLDDGGQRPLLGEGRVANGTLPLPPTQPGGRISVYLTIGVALAGLMGLLAMPVKRRWLRWCIKGLCASWLILSGGVGLFLMWGWTTHHWSTYWNQNVLYFSPLGLVLAASILRSGGGSVPTRWAILSAMGIIGLSVAGALMKATALWPQENGEMLVLALPPNLAVACVVAYLMRCGQAKAAVQPAAAAPMQPKPSRRGRGRRR